MKSNAKADDSNYCQYQNKKALFTDPIFSEGFDSFQIQTIDGRLTLVNSDSSDRFGQISNEQKLSTVKTKHHELGPIAQDQRTFFKAGILYKRPPDSDVIFEPNAVSTSVAVHTGRTVKNVVSSIALFVTSKIEFSNSRIQSAAKCL